MTGLKASTLWSAYLLANAAWTYNGSEKRYRQILKFGGKLTPKLDVMEKQIGEFKSVFILQLIRAGMEATDDTKN